MSRGFSLLELMVVIAIMGVTLAVVAPRLANRVEGAALHNAAAELQSLAKAARGFAVLEGGSVQLALSAAGGEARLEREGAALMAPRHLPSGVQARFKPEHGDGPDGSGGSLAFHPDGSADAGILTLVDSGGAELQLRAVGPLGRLRTVPVHDP
jgi:general secretion pathway protein H